MAEPITVQIPDLPAISRANGDELVAVWKDGKLARLPQAALRGARIFSDTSDPPTIPSIIAGLHAMEGDRWRNTSTGDEWKVASVAPFVWAPDGNVKGADGVSDQPGPRGFTGPAGNDAYQVWLAAGNTGSMASYLASLKGPAGTTSVDGLTDAGATGKSLAKAATPADAKTALNYLSREVSHTALGAGAVARLTNQKLGELVSVDDYLSVPRVPYSTDDGPAFDRAQTAAGPGGVVIVPGQYWINSAVPRHDMVTLIAQHRTPGVLDQSNGSPLGNYLSLGSQIRVTANATGGATGSGAIVLGNGSSSIGITWIADGIVPYLPAQVYKTDGTLDQDATYARITSIKAAMQQAGPLFNTTWGGNRLEGNIALGFTFFNTGCLRGRAHQYFINNRIDCWNGILLWSLLDSAWVDDNHCWPFLTALIPGFVTTIANGRIDYVNRGAYGFKIMDRCDGVVGKGNLAFGFKNGLWVVNGPGLRWTWGWSDYAAVDGALAGDVGVYLQGSCDNIEIDGQNAVIFKTTLKLDGRAVTDTVTYNAAFCLPQQVGRPVRWRGGNVSTNVVAFDILAGEIDIDGVNLESGSPSSIGLRVADGVTRVSMRGSTFKNFTTAVVFGSSAARDATTLLGNTYVGTPITGNEGSVAANALAVRGTQPNLIAEDAASTPAGAGPGLLTRIRVAAGLQNGNQIRTELLNGTAGSEVVRLRVYGNQGGNLQPLTDFQQGFIIPCVDAAGDLGTPSLRWRNIYASNGTLQTSDQALKTAPAAIADAALDAWGEVSPITFQYLAAVAEKGADAARWHFGFIAQAVEAAFAKHGLDAYRYGLIGSDAVMAEVETPTTRLVPKYEPVTVSDPLPPEMSTLAGVKAAPPRTEERPVLDAAGQPVMVQVPDVAVSEEWTGTTRLVLRYDECLVLEAGYQRRRSDRMEARLTALEAKVPT